MAMGISTWPSLTPMAAWVLTDRPDPLRFGWATVLDILLCRPAFPSTLLAIHHASASQTLTATEKRILPSPEVAPSYLATERAGSQLLLSFRECQPLQSRWQTSMVTTNPMWRWLVRIKSPSLLEMA